MWRWLVNPRVRAGAAIPDLFHGRSVDEPWVFFDWETAVDWCDLCTNTYPEIAHFDVQREKVTA